MKNNIILFAAMFLSSCAGPPIVTEDGCFLAPVGNYFIGRCEDHRTAIQWTADHGETYRIYRRDSGEIEYFRVIDGKLERLGAKEPIPDLPDA